jgi:hypothetical protein
MRRFVILAATLALSTVTLTIALAQSNPPPNGGVTYGGRPLVQVKPSKPKDTTARAVPHDGKLQSAAVRLQGCLDLDDGTKDRLNCYDGIYPPKPNPKAAEAKGVADCRFKKEEDERLACFNDFAERIPKLPKS